jgi:hypothetical protein
MALIQYTALVASMSGKHNGSVHTHNKGGQIIRTKVTPINPSTSFQSLQRGFTSTIAKAWAGTLTDGQRSGWTAFGAIAGASNVFGNSTILSGIAAFQAVNRIVLNVGQPMILDAPTTQMVSSILSLLLSADHTAGTLVVTFTPTPITAPQGLYVFSTPAMSAGISNASNSLRYLNFYPGATSPIDITSDWVTRFGPFPTSSGQRIALTAEIVDPTTGAISSTTGTSTIVV